MGRQKTRDKGFNRFFLFFWDGEAAPKKQKKPYPELRLFKLILEKIEDEGRADDGGSFHAQDPAAERDRQSAGLAGEGYFFSGETTLGADEDCNMRRVSFTAAADSRGCDR